MLTGAAFFKTYGARFANPRILDVGAMDVNGTLRSIAPAGCVYTGLDLAEGPGVDCVLDASPMGRGTFPFSNGSFDLVVSTSCFEHDPAFWVTFAEMARVVRAGGFIYVSVPANGPYHGHPGDCWRFYADAGKALAAWAQRLYGLSYGVGFAIELVESFLMAPQQDIWIDNVMVFAKGPQASGASHPRIREYLGLKPSQ
jgi:SAM-dependent methyltransferase